MSTFKVLKDLNMMRWFMVGQENSVQDMTWQACEQFADKSTNQKNKEIGCEEDAPTKQILALDEDSEKVLKVFKY